jgi:hypothetical protein
MTDQPLHEWLRPKLLNLLHEAEKAGYDRSPIVAVMGDIMMDPTFNTAPLPPEPVTAPMQPVANPIELDFDAPSVGSTEWIKPVGWP